jgi:hypothetical protein
LSIVADVLLSGGPYPICKRSAKYVDGWGYCSKCQYYYPVEENSVNVPIPLRTSPRKKKENGKG